MAKNEPMATYSCELAVALQAVQAASWLCARVHADMVRSGTLEKDDRSPVTIADYASQAVAVDTILRTFPHACVVGEEDAGQLRERADHRATVLSLVREVTGGITEGRLLELIDRASAGLDQSERTWTLDPIDGTLGFLRGEQYAVALALMERGDVVLGVLGCPRFPWGNGDVNGAEGCLVYAVRGEGAFMCRLNGTEKRPISVDRNADPRQARFCEPVEKSHGAHDLHAQVAAALGVTTPPYRIDSQAKYAAVARGDASLYLRLPTRKGYREAIWDHAAGSLIVEEAGGRVTDIDGRDLDFSTGRRLDRSVGVVVSNGLLHQPVLQAIARLTLLEG